MADFPINKRLPDLIEPEVWIVFNRIPLALFCRHENPIGMGIGAPEGVDARIQVRYDEKTGDVVMEQLM